MSKLDPIKMLDAALDLMYFYTEGQDKTVIPYRWHKSTAKQRLVVIVGENASGKSFLRRILYAMHQREKCELIHLSMEGRKGYLASFVYGDESWQSTGDCSIHTVLGAMKTADARTDDGKYGGRTAIFWDEPDIGLSDSWAAGVGARIAEYAKKAPAHVKGMYVVTHRKCLLEQLEQSKPHFVWMGEEALEVEGNPSLQDYLSRPIKPRLDLESLGDLSHSRFLEIDKILKNKK